jgi:hypothetical protein
LKTGSWGEYLDPRENGERRRLHNEELHSLYHSPIVRVIKSRRLRWERHVARMEEGRSAFITLQVYLEERDL